MEALQYQTATPESVWAILQEVSKKQEETALQMQETDRRMQELQKSQSITSADFDRRMKEINKTLGGWANNHGTFAEEYFYNSFENGKKNFFGEHFDEIKKKWSSSWQGVEDEYDIVLCNHTAVAIIEVKYKAHVNDIPAVLKKAETFRILFPNYKDFKIYLGLASLAFYPELEQECIKEGIAIIKQVGDTVIINDNHLKVF